MEFYIERYRGIEEKVYNCEVVTPLFMSGADQKVTEIRGASIKGLLRFWWRANFQGNLKDMKTREDEIFGSTTVRSQVEMFVEVKNSSLTDNKSQIPKGPLLMKNGKARGNILKFLEYGADKRPYINPGTMFNISLKCPEKYSQEVDQALKTLLAVGNIGSKSRNGFGSIHCPENLEYKIPARRNPPSYYISFTTATRQYITNNTYKSWSDALAEIGLAYAEARFSLNDSKRCEQRKYLAKPIIQAKIKGRLSKPLFLHISKVGNNMFRGQITVFPTWPEKESEKMEYNRMMESFFISLDSNPSLKEVK